MLKKFFQSTLRKIKQMEKNNIKFGFFGTSEFSVYVLEEMKKNGLVPSLIVSTPDKPSGRKLIISPTLTKKWAEKEKIEYIQPKSLRTREAFDEIKNKDVDFDVFIVASYGKIIPKDILEIPNFGTLNVHPSLLPKLRGSSPIQSSILTEEETGVTIIKLDEEVDHGPILSQEKIEIEWPPYADELERLCGEVGGKMLSKILPDWIKGKLSELPQNHERATFTTKVEKSDGEINLADTPQKNLRKIRAFNVWPGAFYFENINGSKKRIVVKKARVENNELVLERIIPEGKKEMDYKDFLRGLK